MTRDKLKLAEDLRELIDKTEKAVVALENWILRSDKRLSSNDCAYGVDRNYFLCISEHSDGSGNSAVLTRCLGNTEVIKLIHDKVAEQLEKYKFDFEAL